MTRLEKQMQFALEMDKLKYIQRQTYVANASKKENDAEHSWHMALMCLLLSEYANEDVDKLKVMSMVLLHDAVEVDAGDTYAYDEVANATKREREVLAAERIFNMLPEDQAKSFRALWDEFEANESPEAKFAHTLDNIQPIMLNDATDGRSWREHGVKLSQIEKRNQKTAEGSVELWNYVKHLVMKHVELGNIKKD